MDASSPANSSNPSKDGYVDKTDDCAICLSLLTDKETIKLGCGHLWHLECIKRQLELAVPNPGKRLLFSGCRCAKCGVFCEHDALKSVMRASSELREAVDELIIDQLEVDELATHPDVLTKGSPFYGDPLALGRALYAFFQCGMCSRPYFGGTVACSDVDDELLPVAARVCPSCAPASSAACVHPNHVGFHVWKCRYCCSVASYVCYGTTHLCDACHKRDEERMHADNAPRSIPALPCVGHPGCTLPMRATQDHHENGTSHSCEQVVRCTLCASDPLGVGLRETDANTSPNLIFNGDASHMSRGWTARHPDSVWNIEQSEVLFRNGTKNFVCSYHWASMAQVVDLRSFLAHPALARLQVSARFMARTDCPSVFTLAAALYDANSRKIERMTTGVLNAPADFWEPVNLVFAPQQGAAFVVVSIEGKDEKTWAGNYGSKVTDIAVRVLFNRSLASESEIMHPNVSSPTTLSTSSQTKRLVAKYYDDTEEASNTGYFWW